VSCGSISLIFCRSNVHLMLYTSSFVSCSEAPGATFALCFCAIDGTLGTASRSKNTGPRSTRSRTPMMLSTWSVSIFSKYPAVSTTDECTLDLLLAAF